MSKPTKYGTAYFIGNGRLKGKTMTLSFNRDDISNMLKAMDSTGWVNLRLQRRIKPMGSLTHYMILKDWKPRKIITNLQDALNNT